MGWRRCSTSVRVWYLGSGLPVTPTLTTGLAATRSSPDTELVAEHRHRPWGQPLNFHLWYMATSNVRMTTVPRSDQFRHLLFGKNNV